MKWMILDVIEVCYRGIERPCALYAGTFFKRILFHIYGIGI